MPPPAALAAAAAWNALDEAPAAVLARIVALRDSPAAPVVVQSSALGPSGLVISHMLRGAGVPIVFIDTLYHFDETLALLELTKQSHAVHVFTPLGAPTREAFEAAHGTELWATDPDKYDYLVKAEPGHRAFEQLGAQIVITGRRRSQGAERSSLSVYEWDSSFDPPVLKVNPLANWSFDQVWAYIRANGVAYNALHDKGYKSIGDWHSTQPTAPGEGERDGRWKGQAKSECGLHKDYFKMRAKALADQRAAESAAESAAVA
ncbi:3'-phosphoadenylsulfate reductase [Polyrhizophydium stewartii]|uniref:3'-phosphoadenylsulfate reductase n=1 Tax=Polyrhizophydium stewartii TaxID=2732419 RepID=A0ABR4NEH0_9FUNG